MLRQVYLKENVLEAARKRIKAIFDNFENISVSISGGKDSTVTAFLTLQEAEKRNRKVKIFFLDEEVDYESTIEQVKYIMFEMFPNTAIPVWFQFPFNLTNATSLTEEKLIAWEEGKHKIWMRAKDSVAIKHCPYPKDEIIIKNKVIGFDFYDVLETYESHQKNTCFIVGLRAVESMNRWRAVSKNPAIFDWYWSTALPNNCIKAYPLYDWLFSDVWKFIYDNKIQYNKIYDFMWKKNTPLNEFRISSLIHEKSFKSIVDLPEFEPKTYNRLIKRVKGIITANLYGKESLLLKCRKLPSSYKNWKEYRDFLISTYPQQDKVSIFVNRFQKQKENEYVYRQQCRQIILNDLENNLPVDNKEDPREDKIKKWMQIL